MAAPWDRIELLQALGFDDRGQVRAAGRRCGLVV